MAFHLDRAGDSEAAFVALLAAADAAETVAPSVAFRHLELGPHPRGEAFGHERLGRYLWSSGQLEVSRAEFEKAATLLSDEPGPAEIVAGVNLYQ